MQKMREAIERAQNNIMPDIERVSELLNGAPRDLLLATQSWSKDSLMTFTGELLRKAMLLAAAMAEFAHELQNPS